MKWYQVDSDTPDDPRIVLILRGYGDDENRALGALFRLWCYVACKGVSPGVGINDSGQPFPLLHLAAVAHEEPEFVAKLLDRCAEYGHIDKGRWRVDQAVVFKAMVTRGDTYSQRKQRKKGKKTPKSSNSVRTDPEMSENVPVQDSTKQDTTKDQQSLLVGPDNADRLVALWNETVTRPIPKVKAGYSQSRRRTFGRAMLEVADIRDWRKVFEWMNTAEWGRKNGGPGHRNFVFQLDWVCDKPGRIGQFVDRVSGEGDDAQPESQGRAGAEVGKYDDFK